MSFNDHEKARVKHFLSYADWRQLSNSIQLGMPSAGLPLQLVEQSFQRLSPGGEESVRRDLCECESIEQQMSKARARFPASKLGELHVADNEPEKLRTELKFWCNRLCDDLGAFENAFSQAAAGIGGMNARVVS
jgi:hypothetical protein